MSGVWNRRQFVRTAAGAALVCAAGPRLLAAADNRAQYGGFLMGLQSYTLRSFPVDRALATMQELGLSSVEFFDAHFSVGSTDAEIAAMQAKARQRGLAILGHGVNPFTKDEKANRRYFEFAKKVGIRNISADPAEDAFASLDKLVKEFDIRIAIHNHGPGARYDKVADVLNAIKGHDERIGACADLGHYIRSAEDPVRVIHLLKGRLYGVHLKDFAEQKANTQGVILGKGHLDLEGTFRALKKVEFPADGSLSLEYEEHADDPVADVKECLAVAATAATKVAS